VDFNMKYLKRFKENSKEIKKIDSSFDIKGYTISKNGKTLSNFWIDGGTKIKNINDPNLQEVIGLNFDYENTLTRVRSYDEETDDESIHYEKNTVWQYKDDIWSVTLIGNR